MARVCRPGADRALFRADCPLPSYLSASRSTVTISHARAIRRSGQPLVVCAAETRSRAEPAGPARSSYFHAWTGWPHAGPSRRAEAVERCRRLALRAVRLGSRVAAIVGRQSSDESPLLCCPHGSVASSSNSRVRMVPCGWPVPWRREQPRERPGSASAARGSALPGRPARNTSRSRSQRPSLARSMATSHPLLARTIPQRRSSSGSR